MNFLRDPDPDWAIRAAVEIELWSGILGAGLLASHHIGSTSVPDLAAKPVIDLLPVVASLGDVQGAVPALSKSGYEAMGAFGLEGRLYFRKTAPDGVRLVQAHVYADGDPSIARHVAFRDMLRADPEIRQAYEDVKRHADTNCNGDINTYMDLKDPWIKENEQIALARYGS